MSAELLRAIDSGDYPSALGLWDKHITTITSISAQEAPEVLASVAKMEFTFHLVLVTHPFRVPILRKSTSLNEVSSRAAVAMVIFRNFIQLYGQALVNTDKDYLNYRILHKVAFPPTHPMFRHLFNDEW